MAQTLFFIPPKPLPFRNCTLQYRFIRNHLPKQSLSQKTNAAYIISTNSEFHIIVIRYTYFRNNFILPLPRKLKPGNMKSFLLFTFMMCGILQLDAQELYAKLEGTNVKSAEKKAKTEYTLRWEFYSALKNYTDHTYAKAEEQLFGKDIACLLALLDEKFIQKDQVATGDPEIHTRVIKPIIYHSVKNITKHYKQKIRNQTFHPADSKMLAQVVKVALACVDDNSTPFEEALKQCKKDPKRQLDCFKQVQLKNIYE